MEVAEGGPWSERGWGGYELYGDSKGEDGDGNGLLPRHVPTPQSPPVRDKDEGQPSSSGGTGVGSSAGIGDAAAAVTTTAMDVVASSNAGATTAAGTSSTTHSSSGGGDDGGGGIAVGLGGMDGGSSGIGESVLRAVSEESEREYIERALLNMVQSSSSSGGNTDSGVAAASGAGDGVGVGSVFGGGESEEEMLERAKRESLAAFGHAGGGGFTHSHFISFPFSEKYTCTRIALLSFLNTTTTK